jgi:hypothetical protein
MIGSYSYPPISLVSRPGFDPVIESCRTGLNGAFDSIVIDIKSMRGLHTQIIIGQLAAARSILAV